MKGKPTVQRGASEVGLVSHRDHEEHPVRGELLG